MSLLARCVLTEAGLRAIAGEWDALWRSLPDATPFQSPAWLLPWWAQFGTARPVIGVLRHADRLVGLLPAYVLEEGGSAKLLPIGAGISDTLDALIAPDAPPDAAGLLLSSVVTMAGVAVCDLIDLPPSSPLRSAPAPAGWRASLQQTARCPVLGLPASIQDLRQAIPPGTHRKLRMNRHRAKRAGGLRVQLANAATLPDTLDALFAMHSARWTVRGEPGGVLADSRVRAVIEHAAPALLEAGALRLAALSINDEVAACCYALAAGPDRLLLYMSGFSNEHAFCSPGSLLLGALAEAAIEEGRSELHFLRGDEAYKYAWGATDRTNATRHLQRL